MPHKRGRSSAGTPLALRLRSQTPVLLGTVLTTAFDGVLDNKRSPETLQARNAKVLEEMDIRYGTRMMTNCGDLETIDKDRHKNDVHLEISESLFTLYTDIPGSPLGKRSGKREPGTPQTPAFSTRRKFKSLRLSPKTQLTPEINILNAKVELKPATLPTNASVPEAVEFEFQLKDEIYEGFPGKFRKANAKSPSTAIEHGAKISSLTTNRMALEPETPQTPALSTRRKLKSLRLCAKAQQMPEIELLEAKVELKPVTLPASPPVPDAVVLEFKLQEETQDVVAGKVRRANANAPSTASDHGRKGSSLLTDKVPPEPKTPRTPVSSTKRKLKSLRLSPRTQQTPEIGILDAKVELNPVTLPASASVPDAVQLECGLRNEMYEVFAGKVQKAYAKSPSTASEDGALVADSMPREPERPQTPAFSTRRQLKSLRLPAKTQKTPETEIFGSKAELNPVTPPSRASVPDHPVQLEYKLTAQHTPEIGILGAQVELNSVPLPASASVPDSVQLEYKLKEEIYDAFADKARTTNAKSPSTASEDSAKGSSLLTDSMPHNYVPGDIFWAHVHSFCYWPAIVVPDYGGHTTNPEAVTNDVTVHVVFFENTARSGWVSEENLIPFKGLSKFEQLKEDALVIYGKNSLRYKSYVPKTHQRRAWLDAIQDANKILEIAQPERVKAFFENVEKNKALRIEERKQRLAMRLKTRRGSTDSLLSPAMARKRERSPDGTLLSMTPTSFKRRKISPLKSGEIMSDAESLIKRPDLVIRNIFGRDSMMPSQHFVPARILNRRLTIASSLHRIIGKLPESVPMPSAQHLAQPTTPPTVKPPKETGRPIAEVIDDILELDEKYLFTGLSRDPLCKYCFRTDANLKNYCGGCHSYFHTKCTEAPLVHIPSRRTAQRRSVLAPTSKNNESKVAKRRLTISGTAAKPTETTPKIEEGGPSVGSVCRECASQGTAVCKACQKADKAEALLSCNMPNCQYKFHESCCNSWPQAKVLRSKNVITSFRCPCHVCHQCVSSNPKTKFQKLTKTTRCIKCPATYDTDSNCIPAGAVILNAAHIICPRHLHEKPANVNFCCGCGEGGSLLCCDTCSSAMHIECLPTPIDLNADYVCEDCDAGRLPLYGEMIWAKFNNFRWWPGIILPPTEIPENIQRIPHGPFEFVVRFMGTHDHAWISYRRVHDYTSFEDRRKMKSTKSSLDANFIRAAKEAEEIYEGLLEKRKARGIVNKRETRILPQPYKKIKSNRGVPKGRVEKPNICACTMELEHPCGPDSLCINRNLKQECHPAHCLAGKLCENQMLETRKSPKLELIHTIDRGFGLVCREPISAGAFIIEYVGEIINDVELQVRINRMSEDRDENYYFFFINKNHIIDAGPMGNLSRFMNHSCDPNCETDKWLVNGITRVAIFAKKDIPQDTELTFNYNWDDLVGTRKKECHCGARNCSGQIGAKSKEQPKGRQSKLFFKINIEPPKEQTKKGRKSQINIA